MTTVSGVALPASLFGSWLSASVQGLTMGVPLPMVSCDCGACDDRQREGVGIQVAGAVVRAASVAIVTGLLPSSAAWSMTPPLL